MDLLDFGSYNLWRLTGSDLVDASRAIESGLADGVFIAPSLTYAPSDLDCLRELPPFPALVVLDEKGLDLSAVQHLKALRYLSISGVDSPVELDGLDELKGLQFQVTRHRGLPVAILGQLEELSVRGYPDVDCLRWRLVDRCERSSSSNRAGFAVSRESIAVRPLVASCWPIAPSWKRSIRSQAWRTWTTSISRTCARYGATPDSLAPEGCDVS